MHTGRCLCSAIQFQVTGEPRSVHYCHCRMCRRTTGSAFAVLAWFPTRSVVWRGLAPVERRSSDIAERAFCGRCGSPLFLKYDDSPEIGLMLGAFDRPDLLVPAYHYGVEARLPWIEVGGGLAEQATQTDIHPPATA